MNNGGVVHFRADLKDALVQDRNGQMLTTNRNGEVIYWMNVVVSERYPIDVGSYILVQDSEKVASKDHC